MECMCAQTRPRSILSSDEFLGNGVRSHTNFKGEIPITGSSGEGRIREFASGRTASQTHYRLSYSGPLCGG